jgi:voltage-gated potassium channel
MGPDDVKRSIDVQRASLLRRLEVALERPMAVLGLIWLVLIFVELTRGLGSFLWGLGLAIWAAFIVDFAVKFTLAPDKPKFLRRNLLTAISLVLPALRMIRILRVVRAMRAVRGLRLLRLLASWNRGMRILSSSLRRRGLGYVLLLTLVVLLTGAAGMYAFEREIPGGLTDFGTALWWTAMILATMGSGYWPSTVEGRLLCLFLAVYAFTFFGYITATLSSYFIRSDVRAGEPRDARAK